MEKSKFESLSEIQKIVTKIAEWQNMTLQSTLLLIIGARVRGLGSEISTVVAYISLGIALIAVSYVSANGVSGLIFPIIGFALFGFAIYSLIRLKKLNKEAKEFLNLARKIRNGLQSELKDAINKTS